MAHTLVVTNPGSFKVKSTSYFAGQNMRPIEIPPDGSIRLTRVTPEMQTQIREGVLVAKRQNNLARVPNTPPGISSESRAAPSVAVPPVGYAHEEHALGYTWVDGAPVYRRVFSGDTEGQDHTVVAEGLGLGVSDIVSLRARLRNRNDVCTGTDSGDPNLMVYVDAMNNLVLQHTHPAYHGVPYHVVVEYTKP